MPLPPALRLRPLTADERTWLYELDTYQGPRDPRSEARWPHNAHFWPWSTIAGTRPHWAVHQARPGGEFLWLCRTAIVNPELGEYPECGRSGLTRTLAEAAATAAGHAAYHDADAAEEQRRAALHPLDLRIKAHRPETLAAVIHLQGEGPVPIEAVSGWIAVTSEPGFDGLPRAVHRDFLANSLLRLAAEGRLCERIAGSWRERTGQSCQGQGNHTLLYASWPFADRWEQNFRTGQRK
ncbi:hypothetical protein [Streptacidiphilus sp. EB103A]|uniref:hypothetical protein n=1 Tax=Streptacidiphilus sp. EB103A TaxID=3156275 RepID=UPI003513DBB2